MKLKSNTISLMVLLVALHCTCRHSLLAQSSPPFRPPAYPLLTHNPYFSIWSFSDHPGESRTKHWTGTNQALTSLVRIDGKTFRLLGQYDPSLPSMKLTRSEVHPTRTLYFFDEGGLRLILTFISPLLPWDPTLLSFPGGYISWQVESSDGKEHTVQICFDANAELCVNSSDQDVSWARFQRKGYHLLRMGSSQQPVLQKSGDNLRIDWGSLYLASPQNQANTAVLARPEAVRRTFIKTGDIPEEDDLPLLRRSHEPWPVMATCFQLGAVLAPRNVFLLLAYDEIYAVEFLSRRLPPYWRNGGATPEQAIQKAVESYAEHLSRCARFDADLEKDLLQEGGPYYKDMAALAYRQALAAHGLVADMDGALYYFPKENFSNGCMGTVDVIYPSAPILLLFNLDLMKAALEPVFRYAESTRWKFPFAPHDLGRYPLANGQVYGGGEITAENQMPVEESANMIILTMAIAHAEGNSSWAERHWNSLVRWAQYLKTSGFDPENQLCTDDFTGHLAHNTNLSVKAILALECFARLAKMKGEPSLSKQYSQAAADFAAQWKSQADDGDHYRLSFDRPATWSQKYNLIWDKILDLRLFDPGIAKKEIAYYHTRQRRFGLPLDNRAEYTKLDWIYWTATLTQSLEDFQTFIRPTHDFACRTAQRVPLTDWYETETAAQKGFQARSVVGGLFIKMLANPQIWQKWLRYRS